MLGGANAASVAYATAMLIFLYFVLLVKIEWFNLVFFVGVVGMFVLLLLFVVRSEMILVDNLFVVSDWSAASATILIVVVVFVYY